MGERSGRRHIGTAVVLALALGAWAASDDPAGAVATGAATSSELSSDEIAVWVEAVLTDAIAPGSIRWDAGGVDVAPTAAVAAVRIPGRDDVLVAVGENVDGSPAEADAPFGVGPLTESLVRGLAFRLIDDGVLDPALTVDEWVPELPNADRVTVQMVIDNETGWSDYGTIEPDPVISDFGRVWTLREAVELRATVMTALDEPGNHSADDFTNEMVMGLIVEEVGGRPLVELVRESMSSAGLDDTLLDGTGINPAGYRHGVFAFNGAPADTSAFDGTSFVTWNLATHSVVSTPADLLDLLDVWASGELFTTDRTPAPDRYAPDPAGNPDTYVGRAVPFNAYCPCTEVDAGIEPTAIGRAPYSTGTATILWRYADDISIVLNMNSGEIADLGDLKAVVDSIHDIAVAAG